MNAVLRCRTEADFQLGADHQKSPWTSHTAGVAAAAMHAGKSLVGDDFRSGRHMKKTNAASARALTGTQIGKPLLCSEERNET